MDTGRSQNDQYSTGGNAGKENCAEGNTLKNKD